MTKPTAPLDELAIDIENLAPVYLTVSDIEHKGGHDRRCVVCLNKAYSFWVGPKEAMLSGKCPFGHSKKEDCKELAVPTAKNRALIRELHKRGYIS